ncbi:type III secretion protein HrpB2 [Burkholderia ubonensis]|uniref:type III secretion protein HrpB2 n=1 Tax=Burkholderia ubonensis TaxID=101571 RepID=UPI00076D876C|nr:type III secretion protein HrpB2 [Burkholderia ubonensis]KVP36385.1 hypothetical protein WJ87_11655 [Burkholderia ubonensis]
MIDPVSFDFTAAKTISVEGGDGLGLSVNDRHLAEKFQELMKQPDMVAPIANRLDARSVVENLIREQNAQFVNVNRHMMESLAETPMLNMAEIHARSMQMSLELASMQLDMVAKMGVVDASKSAIETLMKNQ